MIERSLQFVKNNFLLIVCLLVAAFFRLVFLDRIPVAITGDELFYLLTAKLTFFSANPWNPLSSLFFQYPAHQFIQAELPYFLTPYYWLPIPFSLFSAHFPTAILSILSILFLYLIGKELFGKEVGLLAGFIAAVNPWFIVIGRTFYEMNAALFFFLLTWYVVMKAKKWMVLWSIPCFFLAFYSYIGTKIIAFPFLLMIVAYTYFFIQKKKFLSQYLILLSVSFVFVFLYSIMLMIHPASSRLGEVLTPANPAFTDTVNALRKTTIQYPFISMFENKLVVFVLTLFAKALTTVSFDYLFLHGDLFFGQNHGLFYVIDAFFFVAGVIVLFRKNLRLALLLSCISILSLVPQIIHNVDLQTFTPHIMLLFPFVILFIANGIFAVISIWKRPNMILTMGILVGCVYAFFVGNFFTGYVFRTPLSNTTGFPERSVSQYIALASQKKQVLVYSQSGADLMRKYLFYANAITPANASTIVPAFSAPTPTVGSVQFLGCSKNLPLTDPSVVIVYSDECGGSPLRHGLQISQLSDGGGVYAIINDAVCRGTNLNPYPMDLRLHDFAVEQLSPQAFCHTFVSTY